MLGVSVNKGSGSTEKALKKIRKNRLLFDLHTYGKRGVKLLSSATPVESSVTANSWEYRIVQERNGPRIEWYNTHADDAGGTSVAVLIQYGHATKNGGYVQGRDYINPAIQPLFDKLVANIWKRVRLA